MRRVPRAACRVAFIALILIAARVSAQSVSAAGQPPAQPGRFGFSLECVNGCTWVEAGTEPSYFRFKGEPKVSAVPKGSYAERAGLKVGDMVFEVDSEHVTSIPAGLALSSDTSQRMVLGVRNAKGATRSITLRAPRRCNGPIGVIVGNHEGVSITVMYGNRMLGTVGPGTAELPVRSSNGAMPSDWSFRAVFTETGSQRRGPGTVGFGDMRVTYKVVCHED